MKVAQDRRAADRKTVSIRTPMSLFGAIGLGVLAVAVARDLDPWAALSLLAAGALIGWSGLALAAGDSPEPVRDYDPNQLTTMALALDSAADAIAIFDEDWILSYRNGAFEAQLSPDPHCSFWDLDHSADCSEFREHVVSTLDFSNRWSGARTWKRTDGSIADYDASITPLSSDIDEVSHGFVVVLRDVTEQKTLERQLVERATRDPLTGLPNRRSLLELLDLAVSPTARPDHHTAVLFIDLDNFKVVNDSLGHPAGDKLLIEIAERVSEAVREHDTVGRLGGDEFLVLCRDVTSPGEAMEIASRVNGAMAPAFELEGRDVHATLSVGVAISDPDQTADELLAAADLAAYEAKSKGRDRAELFDDRLRAQANEQMDVASALRHDLDAGTNIDINYSSIVDLQTGSLVEFEATCVWQHPERGLLDATKFMGIAEELGLEVPVNWLMLRQAISQIAEWEADPEVENTPLISVNVSARQLREVGFASEVVACVTEAGIPADRLCLDVTEQTAVSDMESAGEALALLRGMGMKIAISDYGIGASSLAYLNSLPVDVVKLHKSFIDSPNGGIGSAAVVAAIVHMSRALERTVVADGIETPAQLALVHSLRCDYGQGTLFSAVVPGRGATQLITGEQVLGGSRVEATHT